MCFKTEKEMSVLFKYFIESNINGVDFEILEETKGLFGIPDYMLVEINQNSIKYIISFELKLNNWNRALKQAFKYRAFSNESFVVIDCSSIKTALKNIRIFESANIGLASFCNENIFKIHYSPNKSIPFSKYYIPRLEEIIFSDVEKFVDSFKMNEYFNMNINNSKLSTELLSCSH